MLLPAAAAVPDGPHGVDHVLGVEAVGPGDLGLPGFAAAQGPAFRQQLRPRGPVDGAVHPAAPQQGRIGRVDDGVHGHPGDIVAHQ